MLGISAVVSCEEIIDDFTPTVEYGCPTMDYEVKGKVVNSESGDGIEGIRISIYDGEAYGHFGFTLSGKGGEFVLSGSELHQESLELFVKDIDGDLNGLFNDKQQTVTLSKEKDGDGSWYQGRYSASGVVIEMQEKEETPADNE